MADDISLTEHKGWTHPARRPYRFTVLIVVCFMIYGSYFAYDSVGAIEDYLMESMGIGQEAIGLMYSWYSWGAIFTLLAAGWLIDRLGTRSSSILFSGSAREHVFIPWLRYSYFQDGNEGFCACMFSTGVNHRTHPQRLPSHQRDPYSAQE